MFLEGRAGHFVQDHSLEGPTYQYALRKEARGGRQLIKQPGAEYLHNMICRESHLKFTCFRHALLLRSLQIRIHNCAPLCALHLIAFRRAHFGPLSPLSWDYETSLLRLARKKVADISGVHYFFSAERFGLRSLRKFAARLTGFHGFFSGKLPDSGVQVTVVGDETGTGPAADGNEVSNLIRRLLPWGKSSENIAELLSKDAVSPRQRLWLGFRWGRRDTGVQESKSGGDEAIALTIAEIEDDKFTWSRWVDLRRVMGRGRRRTEADTVSEEASTDEVINLEEDEGYLGKAGTERSWLSTGWIPWGVSRNRMQDSVEVGDGAEVREGESKDVVGEVEQTRLPSVEEVLEGKSSLWGWWFSSSSSYNSSIPEENLETFGGGDVMTEEGLKEGNGADDAIIVGDAESAVVASPKEDVFTLRRWLPTTKGDGEGKVNDACADESDLREGGGVTRLERTEEDVKPSPSPRSADPSNVWRVWEALKGMRAQQSRLSDDSSSITGEVPMEDRYCSGVGVINGEVIVVESETRQEEGTEGLSGILDQLESIEAERLPEDGGETKESCQGDSRDVGDQSGSEEGGILGGGHDALEAGDEGVVPSVDWTVNTSNPTISVNGSKGGVKEQGMADRGEEPTRLLYRDAEGVDSGTDDEEPTDDLEKGKRETNDGL